MLTRRHSFLVALLVVLIFSSCFHSLNGKKDDPFNDALEFIAAADMRDFIVNEKPTVRHFMGALQTMRELGPGSFMVSSGDIDPPRGVRAAVDQVLGKNYPWYPVVGNHELDSPEHMEYLRIYNKDGSALPHLVRTGPAGCEETTYSFEWGNSHFVVLNQYYDGISDTGTDGDMVPHLLQWLEQDLSSTSKEHSFIFGHEPLFPMPDMKTGRLRHYDDSLNKYMKNTIAFLQLMQEKKVRAYICGHTHNTSYCNINGVWQIDSGHSRGLEGISPDTFFDDVIKGIEIHLQKGLNLPEAVEAFYSGYSIQRDILKGLDYMDFCGELSYKEIGNEHAVRGLTKFYDQVHNEPESLSALKEKFWKGAVYAPSTFIKFYVGATRVRAEFYRDDGRGGDYILHETLYLN